MAHASHHGGGQGCGVSFYRRFNISLQHFRKILYLITPTVGLKPTSHTIYTAYNTKLRYCLPDEFNDFGLKGAVWVGCQSHCGGV